VAYQAMLRAACAYALMEMLAGYDARNPSAQSPRRGRRATGLAQPGHPEGATHRAREVLDEEAAKKRAVQARARDWRGFRADSTAGS